MNVLVSVLRRLKRENAWYGFNSKSCRGGIPGIRSPFDMLAVSELRVKLPKVTLPGSNSARISRNRNILLFMQELSDRKFEDLQNTAKKALMVSAVRFLCVLWMRVFYSENAQAYIIFERYEWFWRKGSTSCWDSTAFISPPAATECKIWYHSGCAI